MIALLLLLLVPACAALAGVVTWLAHRDEQLGDGSLLARFAFMMGLALLLAWGLGHTDFVRMRIDPAYRIAKALDADPLVDVFRRTTPSEQQFPDFVLAELARGRTLAEAKLLARPLLLRLATDRMGFADAPARVTWGAAVRDMLATLQARDPALCYAAMRHEPLDDDTLLTGFTAAESRAFEQSVIAVHESAAERSLHPYAPRAPRVDFEVAHTEFLVLEAGLKERFGDALAVLAAGKTFPEDPDVPLADACEARLAMLDAALAEPQPMAAMLVDALLR